MTRVVILFLIPLDVWRADFNRIFSNLFNRNSKNGGAPDWILHIIFVHLFLTRPHESVRGVCECVGRGALLVLRCDLCAVPCGAVRSCLRYVCTLQISPSFGYISILEYLTTFASGTSGVDAHRGSRSPRADRVQT